MCGGMCSHSLGNLTPNQHLPIEISIGVVSKYTVGLAFVFVVHTVEVLAWKYKTEQALDK